MGLISLKRSKDADGKVVPGLWENDTVRMEFFDGAWHCQVPVREIGHTNFFEFRPLTLGGKWHAVGSVRTREAGCMLAERLAAGTHVYRGGDRDELGKIPGEVVAWADVANEIAAHPSTH